ncbi:hypothetical protein G5574_23175 (plasmid) [Pantoea stewartii]|uniref:hypothetical protein n=1 Tax=Pantoea stewartii TaxID=66269 RepID=UPI0013DDF2E3|nr:hypothetical protein [Pantoea stewartii]QIE99851.1 hypothetical protein G5574_23175 [Pantoea stewartii]
MHSFSLPECHTLRAAETLNVADLSCLAEQVTDLLPFDADNASRAGAAAAALTAFARYTGLNTDGESAETVIVDFLTDLMHLCSETGMPLCEMLLSASRHWQVEQDA